LCREETQWYLDFSRQYSWIAGVVGWVNLVGTELERTLDEYHAMGRLVGIRWCAGKATDWADEAVLRGLRVLEKRGLPFDWLTCFPNDLAYVPALARKLPDLRIVIDHLAKPRIALGRMDGWQEAMMAAAACPNVYCKLSGLGTEARADWTPADFKPYLKHTVAAFGFERLMFGSDWPVCLLAARSYQHMLDSFLEAVGPLDAAQRGRLMGETAAEFYRIS
jgi:L-fuconolactonase